VRTIWGKIGEGCSAEKRERERDREWGREDSMRSAQKRV